MLRGTLLLGAVILIAMACGTDSNESFESPYSEDGPWRDIAEKGCIEGIPTELHIEVEVDGGMRVLDMVLEGNHSDLRGHLQVDDDQAELRDWDPGATPPADDPGQLRTAYLQGYSDDDEMPRYVVSLFFERGGARIVTVGRYLEDGRAPSIWEIVIATGEFSSKAPPGGGSFAHGDASALRTKCL